MKALMNRNKNYKIELEEGLWADAQILIRLTQNY